MGNQWVQQLSLILQQGVNAACHLLLRECDYDIVLFSNLQLLQSCCLFTQLSSLSCPTGQSHAIRGRWRAFFFIRFMLIQYHACIFPLLFHIFKLWPFLPLRVWNMNLNLLFIAFACLFFFNKKKKQQTPLLMSNWIKLQWLEMCCFDIKVLWRRFRCMLAFAA